MKIVSYHIIENKTAMELMSLYDEVIAPSQVESIDVPDEYRRDIICKHVPENAATDSGYDSQKRAEKQPAVSHCLSYNHTVYSK